MIRVVRLFLILGISLLLSVVALRWGGWLKVCEVRILPTRYVAVKKLTGEVLGANILRLNLEPLRQAILADPRVLGLVTRIDFFHFRVHIEVRERLPLVAVELKSGEKMWVDREGVILEPAEEAQVVGVRAEENRVAPEVVEAALAWARLPSTLRKRYPVLDLSQDQVIAPGLPTILFGAICQVPEKLSMLTTLWREGLLEGFEVVDLRANDVVILKRGG